MPDYDVKLGIWVRIPNVFDSEKAREEAMQIVNDVPYLHNSDVKVELIEKI